MTVFVRAATIALCAHILRLPIADGQALVPGSVQYGSESFNSPLQQLVQDSLVVQTVPTRLIAFMLSGTTSPVDSQIPIASRANGLPIRPSTAKTYRNHWQEFMSFFGVGASLHCPSVH